MKRRRWILALPILLCGATLGMGFRVNSALFGPPPLGVDAHFAAGPAEPGQPRLKALSYNVNFGLPGDEATLTAIEEAEADVVFLQETTEEWEESLRSRFFARYPHAAFVPGPGAGGMGVMSRWPFVVRETIANPNRWFPAMLLRIDTPLGAIQALNVHLHPPVSEGGSWVAGYFTTSEVRLAEIQRFARALAPGVPTIVAGDFNEVESGDAVRFLERGGATDAVFALAGDTTTWHWPVGPVTLRMQLDHLLYSGGLRPTEVTIREVGNSDHFPVLVELTRDCATRPCP